ncbi:hypothetical protein LINGRAHAP2_LOCUS21232 [Linum grandiflorum]
MDNAISLPSSSSPNPRKTRTCLCSPTNHPGSFRCVLHKNRVLSRRRESASESAKAFTLKAFLLQIINPSKNVMKRRRNFQPRPSRFFQMNSTNAGGVAVS